ncbi:MAG: tRNA (adenosine(37)-N6)-dimethylallyltransferase MiaA [Bacteroidetes bacterium]|nr:tRNA (adenosine(37)-N6)-dimethylallyltransferase MiaA [Bacteroidota bacterium]MCL5027347.1 tRNA (adenosine(37)-N6)-dimethylallyltransferase MiaA [Chloroflexota bacterium]
MNQSGDRQSRSGHKQPLVVIVGPTAVGKSALALELGQRFPAEIVSADSRQVYRYMDIGTAKPTPAERALVPHHLIDVVDPDEEYTLAQYQAQARAAISDIGGRGRLPLLVGGTGLYVRAVTEGLVPPRVPPNPTLRAQLEERMRREGLDALVAELERLDPVAAGRIDRRNPRRVIRALEVCLVTGRPFSAQPSATPPPHHLLRLGLTCPRAELYRRIDERVDRMMAEGLLEEVQRLVEMGYPFDLPSMSGIGYRQLGMYLRGEITLAEAVQRTKFATHRYTRQQYTWFRLDDPAITWLDSSLQDWKQTVETAAGLVEDFLQA